jgi:hypothetical protein
MVPGGHFKIALPDAAGVHGTIPPCSSTDRQMARDIYGEVSSRIIAELERGAAPWVKPWSATAGRNVPCNAVTNRPYSGCNVLLLWMAQQAGYRTPRYLTFKQARDLGGSVRRGEHGSKVYVVKQIQVREEQAGGEESVRLVPMLREYVVFNVDQCEGLPETAHASPRLFYAEQCIEMKRFLTIVLTKHVFGSTFGSTICLIWLDLTMPADATLTAPRAPAIRSRISNGSQLLNGVDGRSAQARRYRDLVIALADDLGGPDVLSEADKALVRQAAGMTLQAEAMQASAVRGEPTDAAQVVRVSNALARLLGQLRRKAKAKAAPDLRTYLARTEGAPV